MMDSSAWLIANANSLASKDLSPVLQPLMAAASGNVSAAALRLPGPVPVATRRQPHARVRDVVRLALPDGHQQRHAVAALDGAGLAFEGYDQSRSVRRPASGVDGLDVKVIRPHDMPQLLATGEIDLAITGRDCLMDISIASHPAPFTRSST
jgi:ATP phosphoribosyltransferase